MPSVSEILFDLFGGPPALPGPTPYQPGTPGINPNAPNPYVKTPNDQANADAGAAIMGPDGDGLGIPDPEKPVKEATDATLKVWNNLVGALDRIGIDLHNGIQGVQEGLPIFGTFALLAVVFFAGLFMFLAEGEKAVVREVLPISK